MDLIYLILAGGRGERLMPLTENMPKPLVRFGSGGSIIDYTLYNCLQSNGGNALVLTQYQAEMVERYLSVYWMHPFVSGGTKVEPLAGEDSEKGVFTGTADAVYQALAGMTKLPETVVVLAADHVYRMNYRYLVDFHHSHGKCATVGAVRFDPSHALRFGIMEVGEEGLVKSFFEKPATLEETGIQEPLASMGIYVFTTRKLMRYLEINQGEDSCDFGKDVLPRMIEDCEVHAFDYRDSKGQTPYWMDVGDLPSYWQAQMDLLDIKNNSLKFNALPGLGRLPFSKREIVARLREGEKQITRSAIASNASIGKSVIEHSIIGPGTIVKDGAVIKNSILLDGAFVHRGINIDSKVLAPMAEIDSEAQDCIAGEGPACLPVF
ncbi:MAG: sugar phosphate nucleotidyltransferase [bacterium]